MSGGIAGHDVHSCFRQLFVNAHGVEDQAAASEQSDQGAQADQANQEDQSGNEETPAVGPENVEEATEPGTERDGTAE